MSYQLVNILPNIHQKMRAFSPAQNRFWYSIIHNIHVRIVLQNRLWPSLCFLFLSSGSVLKMIMRTLIKPGRLFHLLFLYQLHSKIKCHQLMYSVTNVTLVPWDTERVLRCKRLWEIPFSPILKPFFLITQVLHGQGIWLYIYIYIYIYIYLP